MATKDRSAALTSRRQAIAIIKNIRRTRRLLVKHPFDATTFKVINGKERGIEDLVGRTIVFDLLTDEEKLTLHRDILKQMNIVEAEAFNLLRSSTIDFFKDLKTAIDNTGTKITDKNVSDTTLDRKGAAVEAFIESPSCVGCLDYERSLSALEHLDRISAEVEQTVPDMEHELDESLDDDETELEQEDDEYFEENHDEISVAVGEEPADPPNEPDPTEEAPEEDPSIPVELPDDESEDDDLRPETTDNPEDDEVVADITWIRAEESYLASANKFVVAEEGMSLGEIGFNHNQGTEVLAKYNESIKNYRESLKKLYDTVNPEECTLESLLAGSTKTYKRFNRIMTLVDKFEKLRSSLDKSCECLVEASKKMLVAATKDPLL